MKQHRFFSRLLALLLCAVLLLSGMPTAFAAKKATKLSACSVKLSYTRTVGNGKEKMPAVTVKNGSKVLKENKHYTVTYRNNVEPGLATVKIKAKGSAYRGSRTLQFQILPKKAAQPVFVKATDTTIKLRWDPVAGATGYVVYDYDVLHGTYRKLATTGKTAKTLKNLQPGTTYLLVLRAFVKTEQGRLYGKYSPWLNARTKAAAQVSLLAPYRKILNQGTFTLTFVKDDDTFAGTPVTVRKQQDDLRVDTKLTGSQIRLLRRADGVFLLLPRLKKYAAISDDMLRDALDAMDYDDLLEDLLETTAGTPQTYTVRSGKKTLTRELYSGDDGSTIACDFDGETLVRLVYTDSDGGVNVTGISSFTDTVSDGAFEIPDDYTLSQGLSI